MSAMIRRFSSARLPPELKLTNQWARKSKMSAPMKSMFSFQKHLKFKDFGVASRLNWLRSCRLISTVAKDTTLELDPQFEDFRNGLAKGKVFSYRKHPGVMNLKRIIVPVKLETTMNKLMNVFEVRDVDKLSAKLGQYLWSRHLPAEAENLKMTAMKLEAEEINDMSSFDAMSPEEQYKCFNDRKNRVLKKLKNSTYRWESIRFDAHNSIVYMAARMVQEYSVLLRVLTEISKRVPDFKPETFFDFGSGTGSAMWAANTVWTNSLNEHYCVDVSADMNTLAQLLLQDGNDQGDMCFKGVAFRQFLPGSHKNKYDLVISAYSLFELPSASERRKVIENLWKKTDGYLVIVEHGTNAGFKVISEAREAVLRMSSLESSGENHLTPMEKKEEVSLVGRIFSPCPHQSRCPRTNDKTPCNFDVGYKPLEYLMKDGKKLERFSYIVFKKGKEQSLSSSWPRVIRPVSLPARHVHCRLCCPNGKLEHHILTAKKNGQDLYKCARASGWGDLLPANQIPAVDKKTSRTSDGVDVDRQFEADESVRDFEDSAESSSSDLPNVLTHNDSWSSIVNHTYREEPLEKMDSEEIDTLKPVM
ncbi:methyltransferase-like protein 17, mitochondrial [Lineus longissimus]|uniref:methyltransferase-like protein 17, mitochondrial n=1 Tax=Lineus longissimus TaxID=88925 RepID=UPI002B4D63F7